MDAEIFKQVAYWFDQINDLTPAEQQDKLKTLEHSDDVNSQVVSWLKSMLAEDNEAEALDAPVTMSDVMAASFSEVEQGQIGAYKIVKTIAQGGMGSVLLATRNEGGFEQEVAIKLPHAYLDQLYLKRFENERQILAKLNHPHIAALVDGGLTDAQRPFLVMEYIKGSTIADYCDAHGADLKVRLNLVRQVCSAIVYAHQQLILHRDLKPENILVDEFGQVKLLDFGIAKLLDEGGSNKTATQIMTKSYASPEQILAEDVTTQSDLFSLAVMAFELISGVHPFQKISGKINQFSIEQNIINNKRLRITQKEQVAQPSMESLSHLPATSIDNDLDVIFSKALAHEPENRYTSVVVFDQDLKNFLNNQPITARKPSWHYRFKKMVQRNKVASVAVFLMVVSLLGGVIFSIVQFKSAQYEAHKAIEVKDFLVDWFKNANPKMDKPQLLVKDLMLDGFDQMKTGFDHLPEHKYQVLDAIVYSLLRLNEFDDIADQLAALVLKCQQQLSPQAGDCIRLEISLAMTWFYQNKDVIAEKRLNNIETRLSNQRNPEEDLLYYLFDSQQKVLTQKGDFKNAELKFMKSLEFMPKNQEGSNEDRKEAILWRMHNLAYTALQNMRLDEAEIKIKEIDAFIEEQGSVNDRQISRNQILYSILYSHRGDHEGTLPYRKKAVELLIKQPAYKTEFLINVMRNYGYALNRTGQMKKAIDMYSQAIDITQQYGENLKPLTQALTVRKALVMWQIGAREGFSELMSDQFENKLTNSTNNNQCYYTVAWSLYQWSEQLSFNKKQLLSCQEDTKSKTIQFFIQYILAKEAEAQERWKEAQLHITAAQEIANDKEVSHVGLQLFVEKELIKTDSKELKK